MENNPNSDQNPEQLMSDHKKSSNDDHDHDHQQYYQLATISSQSSSARSYECSFCKRGFTNAQALGGHMNIHRKDKAKLKQLANFSSHETKQQQQQQITLEINPKNIMPIKPGLYSSPNLPIVMSDSNLEESDSTAIIPSDVATTTSWFLNQEPTSDHHHHHHDHDHRDQMGLLSSSDGRRSQSDPELDLELRLGPEPPQDSSSTAVATRKFF